MTSNEREMFIQLMQAVNRLARAVEQTTPEIQDEERRARVHEHLNAVDTTLAELIPLMDKEWFDE